MSRRRAARSNRGTARRPISLSPSRPDVVAAFPEPEEAAKLAIARRAKPGAPPDHVRLMLTLELQRALAEQLSISAIRTGKNLEAIAISILEAGAKR